MSPSSRTDAGGITESWNGHDGIEDDFELPSDGGPSLYASCSGTADLARPAIHEDDGELSYQSSNPPHTLQKMRQGDTSRQLLYRQFIKWRERREKPDGTTTLPPSLMTSPSHPLRDILLGPPPEKLTHALSTANNSLPSLSSTNALLVETTPPPDEPETKRARIDESASALDKPYTILKPIIEESSTTSLWNPYDEATRAGTRLFSLLPQASILNGALDDCDACLSWDFASQSISESQGNTFTDSSTRSSVPSVSEESTQDSSHTELLEALSSILLNEEQRETLCVATRGDQAQAIIDYLYSVLLRPVLPREWLRRHCLIALYKLCKYSQLYPHCYILGDSILLGACEGFGGFSDIFKGKFGDKELCLKLVRLNRTNMDVMLRRYAKEAILWGQLDHPNITPFYGIYYLDDMRRQLCLVSPWMRNGDVVEYLKQNPSAPRHLLVYDVVAGLDYLHDLGLIHSDLKGANILVNNLEQACITDFGMSFIRTDKTLTNAMVTTSIHGFTQRWASPELLEEEARPTMASDIWALGCVCYEIMTGKLPFEHLANDAQIALALLKGKLPTRPHYVPDQIETVIWEQVDRCWTPEAGKRPKCRDILLKLQWAGLLRKVDYEAQRDSERESQHLRDVMRMGGGERVDLEVVEKVLQGVRGV